MSTTEAQERARATWSAGDFDAIAARIRQVGEYTVERAAIGVGERVLDVACGTGNATIPASQRGARTTGLDITPRLLDEGREHAAAAGVDIEWVEGDAQDLPFDDGSFDVVVSTFGCMFAPDHARTAAEIARVLRPGGRMAIAAWRPEGNIGRFFGTIAEFAPPPPEGFQPPPLWGVRDHVSEIFAPTGLDLEFEDTAVHWQFDSVDETVEEYSTKFGPIVTLRPALEAEGRWGELLDRLRGMYEDISVGEDGGIAFDGEYLLTTGERPA